VISGFWQKIGFWPRGLIKSWQSKKDWIWFHAVSVGELKAIWPLILKINKLKPAYPIMISTTTRSGYELAYNLIKDKNYEVFFFPFDIPYIIRSLLKYASIKLLIISETEIWPILLSKCYKNKVPTILVNARLSDKSFKNYMRFRFYFKNIVNLFSLILSQSDKDAKRYIELGANKDKVLNTGNIKFSGFLNTNGKSNNLNLEIFNDNNTTKLMFASTHKGEEEIAIETYTKLLKNYPNIRLIIAPRHIERIDEIKSLLKNKGFIPVLRTENKKINSKNDIFLLNTIGELTEFYKISDITVLGGTFADIGGHNILEPIQSGSYTIIGPNDFKITELSSIFKQEDAIVQVNNKSELEGKITEVLVDNKQKEIKVKKGASIISKYENILEQVTDRIIAYL